MLEVQKVLHEVLGSFRHLYAQGFFEEVPGLLQMVGMLLQEAKMVIKEVLEDLEVL